MAIRIFRNYWQLPMVVLAATELMLFAAGFYFAALWRLDSARAAIPAAIVFCVVMSLSMASMGLYSARQTTRHAGLLSRIGTASLCGTAIVAIVSYLVPALYIGRGVMLLSLVSAVCGSLACHYLMRKLASENAFRRRILVYGAGRRAATLSKLRRQCDQGGFCLLGFVPAAGDETASVLKENRIEIRTSLRDLCHERGVAEIVVAMDDRRSGFPFEAFLECRLGGIQITDLVTFLERETGKVRLDVLNPSWMIFSEGFRRNSLQTLLERAFDLTASLLLLVLTWPLMVLAAIAIKWEDGWRGSVLYRQIRVGEQGRPFWLLKFRSMREDAEGTATHAGRRRTMNG